MGLCGNSRAEEEALEKEKKAVAQEKKAMEERKKVLEQEKKAMEEAKRALEDEKKAMEEEKRALEEQKKAMDGQKESIESERRAVEEEKKAVEEEKKVLEEEKRGMEEERKVMAEEKQAAAVTTRALVHVDQEGEGEGEGEGEKDVDGEGEEEKTEATPEFTAPEWLDAALIQKALENGGDDRQVEDLSVTIATAPGDNYASSIYRAKAKLSDGEEKSFVVKGPVPGQGAADMMKEFDVFQREGLMLGEVVPKMEALLEEVAPGRYPPLAARCPLYGDSPVGFLVIADLAPEGFKLADRKRGLGLNHSLLAVRTLARFHAASHALLRKEPEWAERLNNMWDESKSQLLENFVMMGLMAAVEACRAWPGFDEYADLLEKVKPTLMPTIVELYKPKSEGFNVISHGDFWVNNMLFRYEDGDVRDLRVVDLQSSTPLSPALDIIYFLSTSISNDVSAHHQDILIREYHFVLQETLGLFGMQAPSLEELLADMDLHGPSALVGTFNVIPVVKAEKPLDFEALLAGDGSVMAAQYEAPLVKRWMQRVLPELARKGWLRA